MSTFYITAFCEDVNITVFGKLPNNPKDYLQNNCKYRSIPEE